MRPKTIIIGTEYGPYNLRVVGYTNTSAQRYFECPICGRHFKGKTINVFYGITRHCGCVRTNFSELMTNVERRQMINNILNKEK